MLIDMNDVAFSYDNQKIMKGINFRIDEGERICIYGPSGCGKTTMLRLICGLEKQTEGKILRAANIRLGVHFQENRLFPWFNVHDNLKIFLGSEDSVLKWLRDLHMDDDGSKYPGELSGGMKRRISLARALAVPSDLVILDEPLRELDVHTAEDMISLIDKSVGSRGLIFVTHNLEEAAKLKCKCIDFSELVS